LSPGVGRVPHLEDGGLFDAQQLQDVLAHLARGRGREGRDGDAREEPLWGGRTGGFRGQGGGQRSRRGGAQVLGEAPPERSGAAPRPVRAAPSRRGRSFKLPQLEASAALLPC
jgi:hypothetical protein